MEFLKKQLFEGFFTKKNWWGDDLTILDQPGVAEKPLIMRKAIAFEKVCKEMPIQVKPQELIVGVATMSSVGFGHTFPRYETDEEASYFAQYALSRKSVWGHHMPFYPEVLNKGYTGLIAEIDERLTHVAADDNKKRNFYEAVRHTLVAAMEVPKRYVELLSEMIENEQDEVRKQELLEIRKTCSRVPAYPAETFQEALQSVWFVHMMLHSTLTYTPLGRFDQYLYPCYEKDIQCGLITKEFAKELVGSFLIKFNERTVFLRDHMENHMSNGDWSQGGDPEVAQTRFDMSNDEEYTYGQSANHWLQSAAVGGLGTNGVDATNDLSFFIIEMINKLELVSPMISARVHKDSPPEYLSFISQELCEGGAQPVLFNDDVIVKGLVERLGIPLEDALDYASDGCWEVLVQGKTEYNYGHIEVIKCMEALYNNGNSLVTHTPVGLDVGDLSDQLDTFDAFYEAVMVQVKHAIDSALNNRIKYYDMVQNIAPEPFLSSMVLDCLEKGQDLTDRGSRYLEYSVFITGASHFIDSLIAFKKLVYEDKVVTLAEAFEAVNTNWEGREDLRQTCLSLPKYGNDNDEADAILKRFFDDFCDYVEDWNRKIDWIYVSAGVATFENYPRFGHQVGASFDGRVFQEAFSSNFSPAVGRDKEGPTAVLLSTAKLDLSRLNSGCPIDLRVSFNKEKPEQNRDILLGFIKSFVELGNIMTITKVDLATLKKAQQEPHKYTSLRVRLGGLTAYFVQLAKAQQDEYMRRTEHKF
jgi:formate C-acetyltransferase